MQATSRVKPLFQARSPKQGKFTLDNRPQLNGGSCAYLNAKGPNFIASYLLQLKNLRLKKALSEILQCC